MLLLIFCVYIRMEEQKSLLMMQEIGSLQCLWLVLEKTWLASFVTVTVLWIASGSYLHSQGVVQTPVLW